VKLKNIGGAHASNFSAVISSQDPFVTININTNNVLSFGAYATEDLTFNITASSDIPLGHIIEIDLDMTADNNFYEQEYVFLTVGLEVEDFETGDLNAYPWEVGGNDYWYVESNNAYEGTYCARSAQIGDENYTFIFIELYVLTNGEISFYKKVSSEAMISFIQVFTLHQLPDSVDKSGTI